MTEASIFTAVAMLVLFVLVKGRSTKLISDLRLRYSALMIEERHLRRDCQQAEILDESAEAQHYQAEADKEKFEKELKELDAQIEKVEGELHRSRRDDEEEDQE